MSSYLPVSLSPEQRNGPPQLLLARVTEGPSWRWQLGKTRTSGRSLALPPTLSEYQAATGLRPYDWRTMERG